MEFGAIYKEKACENNRYSNVLIRDFLCESIFKEMKKCGFEIEMKCERSDDKSEIIHSLRIRDKRLSNTGGNLWQNL